MSIPVQRAAALVGSAQLCGMVPLQSPARSSHRLLCRSRILSEGQESAPVMEESEQRETASLENASQRYGGPSGGSAYRLQSSQRRSGRFCT